MFFHQILSTYKLYGFLCVFVYFRFFTKHLEDLYYEIHIKNTCQTYCSTLREYIHILKLKYHIFHHEFQGLCSFCSISLTGIKIMRLNSFSNEINLLLERMRTHHFMQEIKLLKKGNWLSPHFDQFIYISLSFIAYDLLNLYFFFCRKEQTNFRTNWSNYERQVERGKNQLTTLHPFCGYSGK